MWSQVTPLTFSETTNVSDIEIIFASGRHASCGPFDGRGGVLAHAFYPSGSSTGGDAHFDEAETWTVESYSGY